MSKREKIILIIMALTIVYGFYALFLENPSPGKPKLAASGNKLDTFNKFITNVAALVKGGVSEEETYIIDKIPVKWTKDPLLNTRKEVTFKPEKEKLDEAKKGATAQELGIVYSGFLNMGNRQSRHHQRNRIRKRRKTAGRRPYRRGDLPEQGGFRHAGQQKEDHR